MVEKTIQELLNQIKETEDEIRDVLINKSQQINKFTFSPSTKNEFVNECRKAKKGGLSGFTILTQPNLIPNVNNDVFDGERFFSDQFSINCSEDNNPIITQTYKNYFDMNDFRYETSENEKMMACKRIFENDKTGGEYSTYIYDIRTCDEMLDDDLKYLNKLDGFLNKLPKKLEKMVEY